MQNLKVIQAAERFAQNKSKKETNSFFRQGLVEISKRSDDLDNDILKDLDSDDPPFLTNDTIENMLSLLEKERDTKK